MIPAGFFAAFCLKLPIDKDRVESTKETERRIPIHKSKFLIALLVVLLAACSGGEADEPSPVVEEEAEAPNVGEGNETENGGREILAEGLEAPWEISIADDTFYITERNGTIVSIRNGEMERKHVQLERPLAEQSEAGLLGMAFPDQFPETRTALIYYSYQSENAIFQRVAAVEEREDEWVETGVILDEIPGGNFHQGGRLQFGPDGYLYVTTGDASTPELAQDPDSLGGKILRLEPDGSIPADNPFENSYVYSLGHRNPQGLAWGEDGELYATEHGNQAHDEINRIEAGLNYGWPLIEGDESDDKMEQPVIHSGENTWAPSGMAHYGGEFYFAALRGEGLLKFKPAERDIEELVSDAGRVRDVLAADGGVYIVTNNTDGRGNPEETDDRLIFVPLENDD